MLLGALDRYLTSLSDLVFHAQSRLYWLSLLSAICLTLFWASFNGWQHVKSLFSKHIWFHASSLADLKLVLINTALKLLIFPSSAALIAVWAAICSTAMAYFCKLFDFPIDSLKDQLASIPKFHLMLIYSLLIFLVHDFSRFYFHRLQHKVSWLWAFHQVHHSAEVMTPFTLMRTHPVDSLLARLRDMLALGTVNGVAYSLFSAQLSVLEIIGVNAFGLLFNLLGANLRHSHVPLHFGALGRFFISPAAHQIHHSNDRKHFDKNFGVCLSLWDQIWGSYINPQNVSFPLRYGLSDDELLGSRGHKGHRLMQLYLKPFSALLARSQKED